MAGSVEIAALWLATASKERIAGAVAASIHDGVDAAAKAEIVVVSTHLPRIRMASVMQRIVEGRTEDQPIVVVCHAGGEATARDLVRLGATHVIAEGNEATIKRLKPDAGPGVAPVDENGIARKMREPDIEPLLTGYTFEIQQNAHDGRSMSRADPLTGLATGAAFSLRFGDLTQGESLPRIAFIRLVQAKVLLANLEAQTLSLFRRRLVLQFQQVLINDNVELFQLEELEYAFIAPHMSHAGATELCRQLVTSAAGFTPLGNEPVRLAIGHAGPEVANEPRTLRELAERAAYSSGPNGGVVSGDELALSEANSTEIDAMLALVDHVDQASHHGQEHHSRVVDIVMAIGRELGIDGIELIRLRLAARLHDVGQMMCDDADKGIPPDELSDEALERYQKHPTIGADYLALSTSEDVVAAIRHHHERLDGTGFPDGLEGDDIPFSARIVALADFVEERIRRGATVEEICTAVEESSGTLHDPSVVWAAITTARSGSLPTLQAV